MKKNNFKKLTVTVGIPAHNEELSLPILLESILKQSQRNFTLEQVVVACDGCTDNTARVVKQFSRKKRFIKLIDDGKRLGQSKRLMNFYNMNKSDIFLTFDADTRLATRAVIEEIIKKFENPEVGLVGGFNLPSEPKTFIEKLAVAWMDVWNYVRLNHNNGISMHSHHGCVSAVRKSVAKKIKYPENSLANDVYLYFSVLNQGYKYAFAEKARIYYRLPSTYKDYISQSLRFKAGGKLVKTFLDLRHKEMPVSKSLKIEAWVSVFLRKPILLVIAGLLRIWINILSRWYRLKAMNGIWETSKSTKLGA